MSEGRLTSYAELADVLEALPLLVRETRRRRGLSLRAVGRELDMAASSVDRLERGQNCDLGAAVAYLRWMHSPDPQEDEEGTDR